MSCGVIVWGAFAESALFSSPGAKFIAVSLHVWTLEYGSMARSSLHRFVMLHSLDRLFTGWLAIPTDISSSISALSVIVSLKYCPSSPICGLLCFG